MKPILLPLVACLLTASGCTDRGAESAPQAQQDIILPVDFSRVSIRDGFWSPRLEKLSDSTLPVCIDQIENRTGRIRNFENAAKGSGKHSGIFFDDSDVYKALEGISYSLINNPDPMLRRTADQWVAKIAAAQQPDGYINTYYTLTGLDKRWTDMDKHEMYCAGHMIEAGIAYLLATGDRTLLEVSTRMVGHMMNEFGPGKRHWVPGHEEIELALAKLYSVTGEPKYLEFARWLLEERGHGYGRNEEGTWNAAYYQDSIPVSRMTDITGHAVRCMYPFCGMADMSMLSGDTVYRAALDRVWDDVVQRNMYITGGIGSSHQNEGFTEDYDLPNLEAYCETCASVGMVLWNARMNRLKGDAKYADVMERALYNGALAGISLDGKRFFYVNPLESKGDHHRKAWYGCACCPSQLSRFLPSIGSYIYSHSLDSDTVWVNLYLGSNAAIPTQDGSRFVLTQTTRYPWEGNVRITVSEAPGKIRKELRLRIPGWCKNHTLWVNGELFDHPTDKGYAVVNRSWKKGDRIDLSLAMPTEVVAADPRVKADSGKLAVQRGPLVYCMEEADNAQTYDRAGINSQTRFTDKFMPDLLGGVAEITAETPAGPLHLIPYYAWDNREAGRMKVWIDEK